MTRLQAHAAMKVKLTEAEWREVFKARCRAKRGDRLNDGDQALFERAFAENPERYRAMEEDLFEATKPAGSLAKYRRG